MTRWDARLGFGAVLLAACNAIPAPTSARVDVGSVQPIVLGHCGLLSPVDFAARMWEPSTAVPNEATGSIPGTIVLLDDSVARFDAEAYHVSVLLRPAGPASLGGGCL